MTTDHNNTTIDIGEATTPEQKRTVYQRMVSLFATDIGLPPKENDSNDALKNVVLKLPALTVIYWCEKMTATTFGETFADYFTQTVDLGYAPVAIGFLVFFFVCLGFQLYVTTYWPALFWLTMGSSSLLGTCISDFIDRSLHWGYPTGMGVLLAIVLGILLVWKLSGEHMNVAGPMTRRAELFYWSVILFSNTLGTALGDFMSDSLEWGYAMSAGIVGGILGLCAILAYFTNFNKVFLFWVAFILTRPFGATFGDLMTKSEEKGGKGLGTFQVSMVLLGMFLFAFAIENYQLYKRKQLKKSDTEVAKNSKVVEQETFHIEDGAGVQDEEGRSRH